MGRHKEKRKKHKKVKKHKSERKSSSSSSDEWVEKDTSARLNKNPDETKQEREEWMNISSSFCTTSSDEKRLTREENRRLEKEESRYNPQKNIRELNPYWKDGGDGLPTFKKPTDNYTAYKKRSTTSNWRKQNSTEHKNSSSSTSIAPVSIEDDSNKISSKDLNILASKLVKAELMGNIKLAEELKYKLDSAKKTKEKSSSTEEDSILLTTTNAQGMSRPLKIKSHKDSLGAPSKKQKIQTHNNNNERIQYFADDNKYSLSQMFENEKYQSAHEQNKEFLKIAAKAKTDLDDFFVEEIRKTKSDEKNVNKAISMHKFIEKSLENCNHCLQSDQMRKHLMISMGETIYLSIPPFEPISDGHCFLVPVRHVPCATQLDENEWRELLDFRKSLCNMYKTIDKDIIFFETAVYLHKHPHMVLQCVPVPEEQGDLAHIYFKKAIDESETEWSDNKKLVSLSGRDVRKAVPKGLPYFSVSFGMTEGYAHVIEDEMNFPQNFAQEIIGGMLDLHHSKWRKPQRQNFEQQSNRVQSFTKMWNDFDCTK